MGYYRTGSDSDDLRRCPDASANSGCVGGVLADGEGPCKPSLQGPYCRLCKVRDQSKYYSASEHKCVPCKGNLVLVVIAVFVAAAAGLVGHRLGLWRRCRHRFSRRTVELVGWAGRLYTQLSLRAKIKQMMSLYQVVTRITQVYELQLPAPVVALLEANPDPDPFPSH